MQLQDLLVEGLLHRLLVSLLSLPHLELLMKAFDLLFFLAELFSKVVDCCFLLSTLFLPRLYLLLKVLNLHFQGCYFSIESLIFLVRRFQFLVQKLNLPSLSLDHFFLFLKHFLIFLKFLSFGSQEFDLLELVQ